MGKVKIIDFGLANFYQKGEFLDTFCGSLPYTAPEILRGEPYTGPEIDVWSLGVLLFIMVTGRFPFSDPSNPKNFKKIEMGDFKVPEFLSSELEELIRMMINPDKKQRIRMDQVMQHRWFNDGIFGERSSESSAGFDNGREVFGKKCCNSCLLGTFDPRSSDVQKTNNLNKIEKIEPIEPFIISEVSNCLGLSKVDVYNEIIHYVNLVDELKEFGYDDVNIDISIKILKSPIVSFYFLCSKQIEMQNWFVLQNNKIAKGYYISAKERGDLVRVSSTKEVQVESSLISKIRDLFKPFQGKQKLPTKKDEVRNYSNCKYIEANKASVTDNTMFDDNTSNHIKNGSAGSKMLYKSTNKERKEIIYLQLREIGILEHLRERIMVPKDLINKCGSTALFMNKICKFLLVMRTEYSYVTSVPILSSYYDSGNPLVVEKVASFKDRLFEFNDQKVNEAVGNQEVKNSEEGCDIGAVNNAQLVYDKNMKYVCKENNYISSINNNNNNNKAKMGLRQLKKMCVYAFGKPDKIKLVDSNLDSDLISVYEEENEDMILSGINCIESNLTRYPSRMTYRKQDGKTKESNLLIPAASNNKSGGKAMMGRAASGYAKSGLKNKASVITKSDKIDDLESSSGSLPNGFRYSMRWARGKQRRVMVKDSGAYIDLKRNGTKCSDYVRQKLNSKESWNSGNSASAGSGDSGFGSYLVGTSGKSGKCGSGKSVPGDGFTERVVRFAQVPVSSPTPVIVAQYTPDLGKLEEKAGEEIDEISEKLSTLFRIELVVSNKDSGLPAQIKPSSFQKPKHFLVLTRLSGNISNFNTIATNLIKFIRKSTE
ncbi:Serine/threonine-protein kinase SIK1 [Smittium culicis]|uniref:Serine/threonine-protein kinase SIK1 n=1 Tax=Smittium culicis TaxID=133412 RepID=A0A1R1XYN7_9FUNG|nr:Serine/threonine-protein kinase SIK1 [Smittium culicis]